MALGQLVKRLDGVLADQAEGSRVGLDRKIREAAEHGVKQVEPHAAHAGLGAGAAGGAHDFRTVAPGRHEFRNQFRRILEIGIHGHDGVGVARMLESGR